MQYTWNSISYIYSKIEEHTKKILKVLEHLGLIMTMEAYVITVIEYTIY